MPYDANVRQNGPFLWVALDGLGENEKKTLAIAQKLHEVGGHFGFKVNNDWLLKHEINAARRMLPDRDIFADTKMWNGASTMARSFLTLHNAGFTLTNAHALAGGSYEGAGSELKKAITMFRSGVGKGPHMSIYGLTILTHYNGVYSRRMFKSELPWMVLSLTREALAAGCDGVIVPGNMLSRMYRYMIYPKIVPGVRFAGEGDQEKKHEETVTPESLAGRTDVQAVCGSPIMNSSDPVAALKRMLEALHWEMSTPT
ncbi:MAG TPA: orotidine 5'-phosphate decarboxylase / HUMPS family protein [Candidatus Paceibacterota bacterium]